MNVKGFAAIVLVLAAPANAAEPKEAVACPAQVSLPSEWAGWTSRTASPSGGALLPGQAYTMALAPMAEVQLSGMDGKELPEGSRGAVFTLTIPQAGNYQVTVGDPMWIDLIGPEGVVESTSHAHGPDCSGLGKIVTFPLKQGDYRLELSAAEVPASAVMAIGPVG